MLSPWEELLRNPGYLLSTPPFFWEDNHAETPNTPFENNPDSLR
jgi:hypothetical protein